MRPLALRKSVVVTATTVVPAVTGLGVSYASGFAPFQLGDRTVGRQSDGSVPTTTNQFVTPAGDTIEQTGRPMALKVRPGSTAVNMTWDGKGQFTVTDPTTHKAVQQISWPAGVGSGKISYGGLLYSPNCS